MQERDHAKPESKANPPIDIAKILRDVRDFRGLTQGKVESISKKLFETKRSHVPAESLRKIEVSRKPQRTVPTARLTALAQIFGIYPEEFLLEQAGVYPNDLANKLIRYPDLRPPFDLDISHALFLRVFARADLIQGFLPPGVTLKANRDGKVRMGILIQQLREATAGKHAECVFEVPVRWRKKIFTYILDYYCDSIPSICALRELYGYPAKFAHPELCKPPGYTSDVIAQLTINGLPLMVIEAAEAGRHFRQHFALDRRMTYKRIHSPDGVGYTVEQLVTYLPVVYRDFGTGMLSELSAKIRINTDAFRILWGLEPIVHHAVYIRNMRLSMPAGRVEHDFNAMPEPGR